MEKEKEKLTIHVKFGGADLANFEGSVDEVSTAFLRFLSQVYPSFELLRRITFTVDIESLLKSAEGVFALFENGLNVIADRGKLSDKDAVLLQLTAKYMGEKLGKNSDASVSIEELSNLVGKNPKTISPRISELADKWYIEKVEKGRYKILAAGINYVTSSLIPVLKGEKKK